MKRLGCRRCCCDSSFLDMFRAPRRQHLQVWLQLIWRHALSNVCPLFSSVGPLLVTALSVGAFRIACSCRRSSSSSSRSPFEPSPSTMLSTVAVGGARVAVDPDMLEFDAATIRSHGFATSSPPSLISGMATVNADITTRATETANTTPYGCY